jgi:hypothetical protein
VPSTILQEILKWSKERPGWQRDALRRLFVAGELSDEDIDELVGLCKSAKGLSDHCVPASLGAEHLAIADSGSDAISLESVTHNGGVNALAANQTVRFGPRLTIVYGTNAAGKSGYTRILKLACRSRFTAPILSNVLSGGKPLKAQVTIQFSKGAESCKPWTSSGVVSNELAAVSVFDSQCVPVYLREKTDVAFRPFSLDVFDKLSTACADVRSHLEAEYNRLFANTTQLPVLPEGTKAHILVGTLTSLTKDEAVRTVAILSAEERKRLKELLNQRRDLQVTDPKKLATELSMKADRLDLVSRHVGELFGIFGQVSMDKLRGAYEGRKSAKRVLTHLRESTLTSDLLPETGGEVWEVMWDATADFSAAAYPGTVFPVTKNGARCPLCQQLIGADAASRLKHFLEYACSNAQADVRKSEAAFQAVLKPILKASVTRDDISLAIVELEADQPDTAETIRVFFKKATELQKAVNQIAIQDKGPIPEHLPETPKEDLDSIITALRERVSQLKKEDLSMKPEVLKELRELESRETLGKNLEIVLNEIDRKKRLAAYQQCIEETNTLMITRKSTELTKRLVTDQLRATFQEELIKAEFDHLAIEIKSAGGARGALYHHLVFSNAPGVNVTDVLSEGESRTLSLVAFLTELSTAPSKSAIIFDDPVSSLDHIWREKIARRLVGESQHRQVIVFTHDILFLRFLLNECEDQDVEYQHQYIRREEGGSGICSADLPWIAMPIKERIGKLREGLQAAEKVLRIDGSEAYERYARELYGLLREAWEQAVSEVLLNDVVARYRHSIETKKVKVLHDITGDDYKTIDDAMTETSRWMRGHDHPPADGTPVPRPPELQKRITELDEWVKAIRKRREGRSGRT